MHRTVLLAVPSGLALVSFGWAAVSYFSHVRTRTPLKLLLNVTAPICVLTLLWDIHLGRHALWGALGVCLTTLSLALFWGAVRTHGAAGPAHAFAHIAPAKLVRTGAYRLARHPIYLSYLLGYAGWGLTAETLVALPVLLWLGLLYFCAACQEERTILAGPLAGEYRAYCRTAGMFWPKLIRRGTTTGGATSDCHSLLG